MADLNEQRIQAEIEKVQAETDKLKVETDFLKKPVWGKPSVWVPALVSILGLGTAVTQCMEKSQELELSQIENTQQISYNEGLRQAIEQQADKEAVAQTIQRELQERTGDIRPEDVSSISSAVAQEVVETTSAEASQEQQVNDEEAIAETIEKELLQAIERSEEGVNLTDIQEISKEAVQAISETGVVINGLAQSLEIFFTGNITQDLITKFQQKFNNIGIPTPPPVRIEGEVSNSVQYFYPSDSELAQQVVEITKRFFDESGCPLNINASFLDGPESIEGKVQIRISHSCQ